MKHSILLVLLLPFTVFGLEINKINDPANIIKNPELKFDSLPKQAQLSKRFTPWSSSFWPHVYSGIAFRWNEFYQGVPDFAPMHLQVDDINKEIEELEKKLFTEENNTEVNKEIVLKITKLKKEKTLVNQEKSVFYKKHFFDFPRIKKTAHVQRLKQEEIDTLSPAEKFDIYKYILTGEENNFTLRRDVLALTKPTDAYWEGICHGWSSASLEFDEPRPVSIRANGYKLNFGSSDIKALLSYYHAAITRNWITNRKVITNRVGGRCNVPFSKYAWFIKDGLEYYKTIRNGVVVENKLPLDCVDTNPGAFHVVLSNMIAFKNEGFSAEVVRDKEIWNQPVYKYESEVVEKTTRPRPWASEGTYKQLKVKTRMYYANDGGRMFWINDGSDEEFYAWWSPTTGTPNYRFAHKDFEYYLDLDIKGKIIGGQWLSYERPDFLWSKKTKGFLGTGAFFGIVNYLDDLRKLSTTH